MINRDMNNLLRCLAISISVYSSFGCTVTGQSSREMKSEILNSYLVKSLNRFYSDDAAINNSLISTNLSSKQIREIEREMKTFYGAVQETALKKRSILAQFMRKDPQLPTATLSIDKENELPRVETSRRLETTFSPRVLQGLFRGAILQGIKEGNQFFDGGDSRPFTSYDPRETTDDQKKGLKALLDDVKKVKETPGHFLIVDIWLAFSDEREDSDWSNLVDNKMSSLRLEARYAGALLFILAHEYAHIILDHFAELDDLTTKHPLVDGRPSPELCQSSNRFEYEADLIGLLLLSPYTQEASSPLFAVPIADDFVGYRNFFEYSYPLVGFGSALCQYPSNRERFEFVAHHDNDLKSVRDAEFTAKLEHVWASLKGITSD
ncbi:MAG: hypothetical protein H8K09_14995 [Nitrospira sp.]|nr:hypothetical protein [Nitrospira sp.]